MSMRAFITGVTGFVGGHLAEHLLAQGDEVQGISGSGRWPMELNHLAARVELSACDIAGADATARLRDQIVRGRPDVVYHLAAQSNPQASMADPGPTWALNLGGTLNLLEAARAAGVEKRPRLVLVGTGVSYGTPPAHFLPVAEDCPWKPTNPYAASKAAADLAGIQHVLGYGADVVMVRPFNHAGPRQSSTYVLSGLARQVAEVEAGLKQRVEVGNLEVVRDFTDVRDVVAAYRLLALHGHVGEIYNLGSGRGVKLADALRTLHDLARVEVEIHVDPARVRPIDQAFLVACSTKLQVETGWRTRYTIEQTLDDMLAHWRALIAAESNPR